MMFARMRTWAFCRLSTLLILLMLGPSTISCRSSKKTGKWPAPYSGDAQWARVALRVEPWQGCLEPIADIYRKLGFQAIAVEESSMEEISHLNTPPSFLVIPMVKCPSDFGEIQGLNVMSRMPEEPSEAVKHVSVWEGLCILATEQPMDQETAQFALKVDALAGSEDIASSWKEIVRPSEGPWLALCDPPREDRLENLGTAWLSVRVPSVETHYILEALQSGAFYTSTGPEIKALWCRDSELSIELNDSCAVQILGENGEVLGSGTGQEVIVEALPRDRWIRAEISQKDYGHAWTQFFRLD